MFVRDRHHFTLDNDWQNYFLISFSSGFSLLNDFTCKAYKYTANLFGSLSTLILLYILAERFLSIKFPVESNLLRKKKCQLIYFLSMVVVNSVYFIPTLVYHSIQTKISDDNSRVEICELSDDTKIPISFFLFISRTIVPLILMATFSMLLIYKIVKSKSRMATFYTARENEIFKKNISLALAAIEINFFIFFSNLPIIIIYQRRNIVQECFIILFSYVFYCVYAFKFYFFLLFISLFRREFFSFIFHKKASSNQNSNNNNANNDIEINLLQ